MAVRWDAVLVCVAVTAAVWVVLRLAILCRRRARFVSLVDRLPGPPSYPVVGTCLEHFGVPSHKLLQNILERNRKYAPIYRTWLGSVPVVYVSDPEYIEILLSSSKHLQKGFFYRLMEPWLGTGLLTSTGDKWRLHRKLITPAFHFSILHNFVEVFAEKGEILVQRLRRHADGQPFDVLPLVAGCTLDIICETAMGTKINAQDEKDSEYVTALYGVSEEIAHRAIRPWLHSDVVYFRTKSGKRMRKHLQVIHGFARKVRQDLSTPKPGLRMQGNNMFAISYE